MPSVGSKRVLRLSPDGEHVTVEFYTDEGERIVYSYSCCMMDKPPQTSLTKWHEQQRHATGPVTLVGSREPSGFGPGGPVTGPEADIDWSNPAEARMCLGSVRFDQALVDRDLGFWAANQRWPTEQEIEFWAANQRWPDESPATSPSDQKLP
jgi:hypothetical protein